MAFQDMLRRWAQRLLLSLASAVAVSATAFVCAWLEFRAARVFPDPFLPSLWEFAFEMDIAGVKLSCLLAGALAFPLCLLYSTQLDGKRSSLVKVLIANTLTALSAIFAAVVMAALHFGPWDHH